MQESEKLITFFCHAIRARLMLQIEEKESAAMGRKGGLCTRLNIQFPSFDVDRAQTLPSAVAARLSGRIVTLGRSMKREAAAGTSTSLRHEESRRMQPRPAR